MSQRPDDERDPDLERAWRAQSRELPPPALDRAILAAAHRAVGSGPAAVAPTSAARRPQRWWMPLAAAAAIGVVAIGVLQVAPRDDSLVVPNERVVSDAAAPAAAKPEVASNVERAETTRGPTAGAERTQATTDSARVAEAGPAAAPAPMPARETAQPRAIDAAPAAPPAPAAAPAPEPQAFPRKADGAPAADRLQAQRMEAASAADKVSKAAAGAQAQSAIATGAGASAERARAPAAAPVMPPPAIGATQRTAPAAPPAAGGAPQANAPASTTEQLASGAAPVVRDAPMPAAKREIAPDPFSAAPRANVAAAADAAAPALPPAQRRTDATSGAPTPATSGALEQDARSGERKDAVMQRQGFAPAPPQANLAAAKPQAAAAVQPLAKTQADAKAKARDPDAWLARIRKLRADGNTAEAVRELREFRDNVPDADRLIPVDLRDLANLGPR